MIIKLFIWRELESWICFHKLTNCLTECCVVTRYCRDTFLCWIFMRYGSPIQASCSQLTKIDFYLSVFYFKSCQALRQLTFIEPDLCRRFSKEIHRECKNILYENDLFSPSNSAYHKLTTNVHSCAIIIVILNFLFLWSRVKCAIKSLGSNVNRHLK